MANIHLVTGYSGNAHVTAADHGSLNAAIFGDGQYVLNRGNQLAATLVTNNQVRIADGDILMQGRHIRIDSGSYVDLSIENGVSGYNRNDLIVCRYTKNALSGIEECNLVVLKGTATTGTAADPAYSDGNIMSGGTQVDFILYRIRIDGLAVNKPEPLFEVRSLETDMENYVADYVGDSLRDFASDLSDDYKKRTRTAYVSQNETLTDWYCDQFIVADPSERTYITVPKMASGTEVTIFRMTESEVGVRPGSGAYFLLRGNDVGEGNNTGLVCYISQNFGSITLKSIGDGMWFIQSDCTKAYEGG